MSATFINFTPSTTSVFSFQAQLAGTQYTVTVTWNVFGQRYYITVADLSGNVVLYRPLIACGPQFTAQFEWASGIASAVTSSPHNVPVGSVANIVVSQTDSGFDGTYQALATDTDELTYQLATNPQQATPIGGAVNFNNNLVAPVIAGAYLLFRYSSQQFEFG